MAAAPIKTWSPGETLLLGDLNNEIANIYAEINNVSGANIIDGTVSTAKLTDGANPEVFFGEIFEDRIVVDGLEYASDTGLTITLTPGTAYILQDSTSPTKLVRVVKTLSTTISVSASVTQYIDLKSNGEFVVTTSTTTTTDASRIIEVVTNASTVTAHTDLAKRVFGDDFDLTFGDFKGLTIKTTSLNALKLEADFVVLDETGKFQITHDADITADITVSGVGGLDQGTEATNAWYAIVLIADSTGVTDPDLVLVEETNWNADTEIIPAGYDRQRRVGWVRNTGGNFLEFLQQDHLVSFFEEQQISASLTTNFADYNNNTYVCPRCRRMNVGAEGVAVGNGGNVFRSAWYSESGTTGSSGGIQFMSVKTGTEVFDHQASMGSVSSVPVDDNASRRTAFRGSAGKVICSGYHDPLDD